MNIQERDMQLARSSKANGRKIKRRMPLTITLDSSSYKFIESCISLKEFQSIDEFFDAALAHYRKHLQAIATYAEEQSYKGYSRAEILESIECETLVTKAAALRLRRRRAR